MPKDSKPVGVYHLPFFAAETKDSTIKFPLIGFRLESHFNTGLLSSLEEVDMKGSDLVRVAFSNLKELNIKWSKVEYEGIKFLKAKHAYASEKILDKEFIAEAAKLLGTSSLNISIPSRGIILAIGSEIYKTQSSFFNQQVWNFFTDASKESVSDLIYKVEDGQVVNYFCIPKKNRLDEVSKKEFPLDFYHQKATIKLINGDAYVKSLVGASEIETLLEGCFQLILKTLIENENNNEFTGLIEFQTIPSKIIKTRNHVAALNTFLEKLPQSDILQKWSNRNNKALEVSFIFGEDFKLGAMERKQSITLSTKQ